MPKIIRLFCKICLLLITLIVILLSIAVFRAIVLPKERILEPCSSDDKDYIPDSRGLSKRLSEALKFETVSYGEHKYNEKALAEYLDFLNESKLIFLKDFRVSFFPKKSLFTKNFYSIA